MWSSCSTSHFIQWNPSPLKTELTGDLSLLTLNRSEDLDEEIRRKLGNVSDHTVEERVILQLIKSKKTTKQKIKFDGQ